MNTLSSLVNLPIEQQEKGGLIHTPREIAQQPETWKGTIEIFKKEQSRIRSFLEGLGLLGPVEQRPVVLLIGAGSSDYIGQALALLLRQRWGCEVTACASTDVLPSLDEYVVKGRRYLWVSFSRSGNSPEGVSILEQSIARYPEIAHLVVTCNSDARMIPMCEQHPLGCVVVLDDRVNDRGLAMTSSFTNMVVLGQCLAHAWSLDEYEPVLQQLCLGAQALLDSGYAVAQEIASRRYPRMCLVGIGPLAAVAKESALKVLEMSAGRVKTISETTLGLRHGPMASLDLETILICFLSTDSHRRRYGEDLLREIGQKQITADRLAVGSSSAKKSIAPLCEIYLELETEVTDSYRAVVDVLFGQMLGLCTSVEYGLKPDAPSPAGIISRVVQDFAIYGS